MQRANRHSVAVAFYLSGRFSPVNPKLVACRIRSHAGVACSVFPSLEQEVSSGSCYHSPACVSRRCLLANLDPTVRAEAHGSATDDTSGEKTVVLVFVATSSPR